MKKHLTLLVQFSRPGLADKLADSLRPRVEQTRGYSVLALGSMVYLRHTRPEPGYEVMTTASAFVSGWVAGRGIPEKKED